MGRTFRIDCIVLLCTFLPLTASCFGQTGLPLYEGDIPNAIAGPNREPLRLHAQVDTTVTQASLPTLPVSTPHQETANAAREGPPGARHILGPPLQIGGDR